MKIEIYGKENCPVCNSAKKIVGKELGLDYQWWDMASVDGIAEYCYRGYDVKYELNYPVIVVDGKDFHVVGQAVKHLKEQGVRPPSASVFTAAVEKNP